MKKWFVIAGALLGVGLIIGLIGFLIADRKIENMNNLKAVTRTEEVEVYDSLYVDVGSGDIRVLPSEDEKCTVYLEESDLVYYSLLEKEGALTIKEEDTRKWYQCIGFSYARMRVTVYLPAGEYTKFQMETSSGKIELAGANVADIQLYASSGEILVTQTTCNTLYAKASSGDITMKNVRVAGEVTCKTSSGESFIKGVSCEKLSVYADSGEVELQNIQAVGELVAQAESGDVEMREVVCDTLFAKTSSGNIDLKEVISTGESKLISSSGEIFLKACDAGDYTIRTSSGNVKGSILTAKIFLPVSGSGSIKVPISIEGGICKVETGSGNIRLELYGE